MLTTETQMNDDPHDDAVMSPVERQSAAIKAHKEAVRANPKMPQRELARREAELYATATSESRRSIGEAGMGPWLAAFADSKQHDCKLRSVLHMRGSAADPLWDLVDGEERMPLGTAVRLLQSAKTLSATTSYALSESVQILLSEYLRTPVRRESNGTQSRRMALVLDKVQTARDAQRVQSEPRAGRAHKRDKGPRASGSPVDSRTVFAEIRRAVATHVADKLVSYGAERDGTTVAQAVHDASVELEGFFSSLNNVLLRAEREIKGNQPTITRHKLNDAFRTLNLEPPKPKETIDLKRIEKQKRRMAALYHPDAHGGDRTTEPKYNEVIDAYGVIRDFVNQQNKN